MFAAEAAPCIYKNELCALCASVAKISRPAAERDGISEALLAVMLPGTAKPYPGLRLYSNYICVNSRSLADYFIYAIENTARRMRCSEDSSELPLGINQQY